MVQVWCARPIASWFQGSGGGESMSIQWLRRADVTRRNPMVHVLVAAFSALGVVATALGAQELGGDSAFGLADYAAFADCLLGDEVDPGDGCRTFDFDHDGDVDLVDSSRMQCVFGFPAPPDMALIPAGSFEMGDTFGEGRDVELPVHSVYLDAFFMDKFVVTNAEYAAALNWARGQGYRISVMNGIVYKYGTGTSVPYCSTTSSSTYSGIRYSGGFSAVPGREDHPTYDVFWYGAVAYSNWRSEMEGRPECYNLSTWACDFDAPGYRLPTEAEWEKAARGGVPGHRFPWSDTDIIEHARANYYSSSSYSYDMGPTNGYHPAFASTPPPHTSPVGYFAPNDYGLFDMAGNALQWCNDLYAPLYYQSSEEVNPTGSLSGSYRVLRGCGWNEYASSCRTASRAGSPHYGFGIGSAFRCVLPVR